MTYSPRPPEPHGLAAAMANEGHSQPSLGDEVRLAVGVLASGWRAIAGCAIAAVLLAMLYIVATPPLYIGSTDLLFDPRQKQVVAGNVVDATLPAASNGHGPLIDSQLEIIRSEALARKLVDAEDLVHDPEFAGGPGPLGALLGLLGAGRAYSPHDAALQTFKKRLNVLRQANTYVISIEFKAESPEKAARLANKVAEYYIAESASADASSTTQAAKALEGRLDVLKAAANKTAATVEVYKRENSLIGTENLLIVDQQLRDLNRELSLARVERGRAEASLAQVKRAITSSQIAELGGNSLESTVLAQLQVQFAQLQAEEADMRARYLGQHPNLIGATEKKAALQAAINAEFQRIQKRLAREYEVALDKETTIERQVLELEAKAADSDAASVRLRELQREATAARIVYETFLNRSKEIWEQVGLPTEASRIISAAFPPARPSEPRAVILIVASSVLGTMAGVGLVWLAYILQIPLPGPFTSRNPASRRRIWPPRRDQPNATAPFPVSARPGMAAPPPYGHTAPPMARFGYRPTGYPPHPFPDRRWPAPAGRPFPGWYGRPRPNDKRGST